MQAFLLPLRDSCDWSSGTHSHSLRDSVGNLTSTIQHLVKQKTLKLVAQPSPAISRGAAAVALCASVAAMHARYLTPTSAPCCRCTPVHTATASHPSHPTIVLPQSPRSWAPASSSSPPRQQQRKRYSGMAAHCSANAEAQPGPMPPRFATPQPRRGAHVQRCQICTIVTAPTVAGAVAELREAYSSGADIVELRLDYLQDFEPEQDLESLLAASQLPVIVTCRPDWEGGEYSGEEAVRLSMLKFAAVLGAAYIDIELKAAPIFFAGGGELEKTKVIMSYHDFEETPDDETLQLLLAAMRGAGCHVAKIAAMATDISDSMRMLKLLDQETEPLIALSMGERGLPARLLAPKYGAFLTFGALHAGAESAPGQPTVQQLRETYRIHKQTAATQVYGVIGSPVAHSRSPALHNAALAAGGVDAVYLPLLVDDLPRFLAAFGDRDFRGFSVTLPHKAAALEAGKSAADPLAAQIGAANTLVRRSDGSLAAFNTDCSAAVSAIEGGLRQADGQSPAAAATAAALSTGGLGDSGEDSPLRGKTVVVIGAGGAGRALAFGAVQRGAQVYIANRSREKAEALAAAVGAGASAVALEDVSAGLVKADVLANSTSVGMHPNVSQSPVGAGAMCNFSVAFDAVYTPLQTQLLKDARAAGCVTVSGLEMFVGQAADQFRLFTGQEPPVDLMRRVTLDSLG